MLGLTQWLILEAGPECNLGRQHTWCPNRHPERFASVHTDRPLDDATMVHVAVRAYRDYGFRGLIGFHYYCDPLVYAARLGPIMDRIAEQWPAAHFGLWTNGVLLEQEAAFVRRFHHIRVSDYDRQPGQLEMRLNVVIGSKRPPPELAILTGFMPDTRAISQPTPANDAGCKKPFTEFILDCYGNHHVCCYDWRGVDSLGNVYLDGLDSLVTRWRAMQESVVGEHLTAEAPTVCRTCPHKCEAWNNFVPEVFWDQRDFISQRSLTACA